MYRRPDSVSAVAALNILFGGLALFYSLVTLGNGVPAWMGEQRAETMDLLRGVGLADGCVALICGYNMFHGANWSRWVFTVESIISTVVLAFISGDHLNTLTTTAVYRVICIVILFWPNANEYFGGGRRR